MGTPEFAPSYMEFSAHIMSIRDVHTACRCVFSPVVIELNRQYVPKRGPFSPNPFGDHHGVERASSIVVSVDGVYSWSQVSWVADLRLRILVHKDGLDHGLSRG